MEVLKETKRNRGISRYYDYDLEDCNAIKVQVYYDMGGINYFTYKNESRGVYLSVTPVELGDVFEKTTLFKGYKVLLEEANRYSDKLLEKNKSYLDLDNVKTQELFQAVLSK